MNKEEKVYISRKGPTAHIFCPDPITIDKSAQWGEGNIQNFPKGVFLQLDHDNIITHGVQPNEDMSAPIGWNKWNDEYSELYIKKPVIAKHVFGPVELNTKDGLMKHDSPDGWVCWNILPDGTKDDTDPWYIENDKFHKLYKEKIDG